VLILLDNNVPRGLARALPAHTVVESRERGWHLFKNGDLLNAAEDAAFDVLVTSDKSIRYQQNLTGRKLALVVLSQGAGDWSARGSKPLPSLWKQLHQAAIPK
jgi:hypothetical protein